MATYKEIKGVTVQTRSEDPTVNAGTWATGGSLNTGRESVASSGILTSGQAAAGYASTGVTNVTENYDGTSWTEVGDLNTARISLAGFGTYTSAVGSGGYTSSPTKLALVESWNGTSWSEQNDLSTARYQAAGAGADNNSGLVAAGEAQGGGALSACEEWTAPTTSTVTFTAS